MILHCLRKLGARLPDVSPSRLEETSPIGSWHGHLLHVDRGQCVMLCHAGGLDCAREVPKSAAEVDHFIAWSRYPIDLGSNLVLAHRRCNAKKRDFRAHPMHVASWYRSHVERGACLG